ncbi:galactose ABC transporter substrate-binding protein [Butyrivibrio sp. MC2013]|uniref:galactose ABC transporter substrate-binding protein n=1 Tax=Butyrivibrio sp. MC2013 TaxID=1280686 RepID=UPI000418F3E0|nr:galactose ABC transporter substrate-binding protein [Butyrivibrio sp. MC2013]
MSKDYYEKTKGDYPGNIAADEDEICQKYGMALIDGDEDVSYDQSFGSGKKILRKVFYTLIAFMIIFLTINLYSCKPSYSTGKSTIRIGVSIYDSRDTFINQYMDSFNSFAGDNVAVVTYNAAQSQNTQNDQAREMIDDGCDVICINLVDRTEPAKIIDMAKEAGVPVIFFNRELVPEDMERWDRIYYVGADARQSGIMEGEVAAEDIARERTGIDKNDDGIVSYVLLEGEAGHQDASVRSEYSVDTIQGRGIKLDRVGYAIANWSRSQAQTKVAQFIDQGLNIEMILANNDDMALGAIDAYLDVYGEEAVLPAIYGIDGTTEGLEAVRKGYMKGTVYNDKEGQARAMYDLSCALARNESIENFDFTDGHYIRLPYSKVSPYNVDSY